MAVAWKEHDLRDFLKVIGNFYFDFDFVQDHPSMVDQIVRLCLAVRSADYDQAQQIHNQVSAMEDAYYKSTFDIWSIKCLLFFGAERDMRLVRYVVESMKLSRHEILGNSVWTATRYDKMGISGNVLVFAVENGQTELAEYLLQDWISADLAFIGIPSFHHFDSFSSAAYFTDILECRPQSFPVMSYKDQSIWLFCRRYLKTECPVENWDEAAMTRLQDDDEFTMSVVRLQDGATCLNSLWELYGHNQDIFLPVADMAEGLSIAYFLSPHYPGYTSEKRQHFFAEWAKSTHPRCLLSSRIIQRVQSHWIDFQQQWLAAGGRKCNLHSLAPHDHPFDDGRKFLIEKLYPGMIYSECMKTADFFWKLGPELRTQHHASGHLDSVSDQPSEICYLLAAAGSGKTHRIFKMLEERFGFYIASGEIRDQADQPDIEDGFYLPRASMASGDVKLLNRTLDRVRTCAHWQHIDHRRSQVSLDVRCNKLLESRKTLLFAIFEYLTSPARVAFSLKPWHWLQYQLSFTEDAGPFTRSFRCLYLSDSNYSYDVCPHARNLPEESNPLLWCFDEVQCYIGELTAKSTKRASGDIPSTTSVLSAMISSLLVLDERTHSVIAGTALNLPQVDAAVKDGVKEATDVFLGPFWVPKKPSMKTLDRCHLISIDEFDDLMKPTVDSLLEAIWNVTSPALPVHDQCVRGKMRASLLGNELILEDAIFLHKFQSIRQNNSGLQKQQMLSQILTYFRSEPLCTEIRTQSLLLLGRYRWCVCYIEELCRNSILHDGLNVQKISNASAAVQKAAKGPLTRRIRELAISPDPQKCQLAIDVVHMAIQFELYGRSRILNTPAASFLIEQGLGYVQDVSEGRVKVCLAERLVTDAAIEYARETNLAGNIIGQHLGAWQYSASSFGFITEDFLGEAIYSNAHESQDQVHRALFLSNFDSVHKIMPNSTADLVSLDLGSFVLEQRPLPAAVGLDETGDVGQWLEQVVLDQPRRPFLLPSKSAGPDLMFVLCNKSAKPVQRLVCAVQAKVVKNFRIHDKVLNTLDPDQWYRGSTAIYERGQFLETLNRLKNVPNVDSQISYLSILLLVCSENVNHKKIIDLLIAKKNINNFAQDIVSKFEGRSRDALEKLEKEQTAPRQQDYDNTLIDVSEVNRLVTNIQRTDYYGKIVTSSSVEPIFGQTYSRIAQGMKDKAIGNDDGESENEGTPYIIL